MNNIKLKIKDVFADYEPIQNTKVAPIVVSNHSSWADMFYYLSKNVSFLSKKSVAFTPLIGWHSITRQCIFISREDSEDRNKVLNLIKERSERIKTKGDMSPLLIFPEGTTTNGRVLMKFKRGAFITGDPIKIYVMKYGTDHQLRSSIESMSPLDNLLLTLCQWSNSMTLYEYEDNFDPEYVYKKFKVDKTHQDSWEAVAREIKTLMLFISGYQSSEDSFRETLDFEKEILTITDEIKEPPTPTN